ncbi:ATP synthase subunit alpha [Chlorella sorokiniana]|uniref:ATP synthase subunit alpha n=1 Tax=Chlorella sorokiniana TaxID=3076 RepID=A0A2P6TL93_CHLSO|nr:ATP synthase subunit alpha [Chlorella sorokiniana]|eukprot:PRW45016.1 ATP synthase subunit alpha [Chlorella sorokiniana]
MLSKGLRCGVGAPPRRLLPAFPSGRCGCQGRPGRRGQEARATDSEAEPNWEEELKIFKQRTLAPSQLEVQRQLAAEKVDVGRVLYAKDNVAIIEGLNNDADVGTCLAFSSGARGVMLWRRSDNIVFALLLGGAGLVAVGDGVECRVKGILQVVDASEGPSTKREYEQMLVPVGDALVGQVVDFLGRPYPMEQQAVAAASSSSSSPVQPHPEAEGADAAAVPPIGTDAQLPLLNGQPDMDSREQINEALMTGVRALDILTPLGRGQALQVVGPQGSGKTQLCIDAVIGQRGSGVRCVYAAVGSSQDQLERTVEQLRQHGCMDYTTVVAATGDRPLGEQYAAMLTACSIAERVRDEGGHALVVLNDASVMVRMWEMITWAMAGLGSASAAATEEDLQELQSAGSAAASAAAGEAGSGGAAAAAAEGSGAATDGASSGDSEEEAEELVEYEGMLVSAAAAQRRRFFSSLIQRAAKMHRRLRGGSMSMLLVTPGVPASGEARRAREKIAAYKHLSEAQKAKLLAAIDAKERAGGAGRQPGPQELRTEVVEELMSITDGQVVLRAQRDAATGGVAVDPQLSVSRIGSRAYHPAMEVLAPQVRLDLAQAVDAARYSTSMDDPAVEKAMMRAAVVAAALPQPPHTAVPLEQQVVQLLALQRGFLDGVAPEQAAAELDRLSAAVAAAAPAAVAEVAETRQLTAAAEAALLEALQAASQRAGSSVESRTAA